MIVRKEKEIIIFDFENGKTATYNMNTGETIGKMGKPVNSLCVALQGYDIEGVLRSFENQKYADFLRYVLKNLTPTTYRYTYGSQSRVKNLGTLFNYATRYKVLEGYMLAGLRADPHIRIPISEVPKGLLKLCRKYDKEVTRHLVENYKSWPDGYNVAFSMEFENLTPNNLFYIMSELTPSTYYSRYDCAHQLVHVYNYDLKALLKYLDYLVTFEGIDSINGIPREIGDYANMMRQISAKYEKYPRYFLSTHKIAARNYNRLKHEFDEINFAKQIKPEYEITYKDYVFIYPKTTQEIKDEAVQQQNCVASYVDKVINGACDILFLRKKDNPTKSLVTIEVRNGKIVQARQAYNNPCTEEQQEVIEYFNKKFSKKE